MKYVRTDEHKRFDQRQTIFNLERKNKGSAGRKDKEQNRNDWKKGELKGDGEGSFEEAARRAAGTVYRQVKGLWSSPSTSSQDFHLPPAEIAGTNPRDNTRLLKQQALNLGSDLVGIARLERRWVYSHRSDGRPISLPDDFRYVVVMAVAMDPKRITCSPGPQASTETRIGYARMSFVASLVSELIASLGYRARPCAKMGPASGSVKF